MKRLNINSRVILNNDVEMPILGLGVYNIDKPEEVKGAIKNALNSKYSMFDTASRYGNEKAVGEAISEYGLLREEFFITTKLWNTDHGYNNALKAIDKSLEKLGLSYVDLYLIHWPSASEDEKETINKRAETWKAMEEILEKKKARAIGVSNYTITHLEEMKEYANVMPMINQVEFNPFLYQKDLLDYCKNHNIAFESYSPLAKGQRLNNSNLISIGKKHKKTPAQVMLRWALEHGTIVIPKSTNKENIFENIDIFDFELDSFDMNILDNMNEGLRLGWDPTLIK